MSRVLTTLTVFLPLAVVLLLYANILWVIRKKAAKSSLSTRNRKDTRTAVILFGLCAAFAVSYVPQSIYLFMVTELEVNVQVVMYFVTWYSMITVAAINPVLYALLFKRIGAECKALFFKGNNRAEDISTTT